MKKIISALLVCLCLLSNSYVYAEENIDYPDEFESYEQYINDPHYYDYDRVQERKISELKDNVTKLFNLARSGSTKTLNIPKFKQEEYYFCGPATTSIVLQYKTGTSYNQYTLASQMGTTSSSGTMVYQITNKLNSVLGANTYTHLLVSSSDFQGKVVTSITNGYPVICNANTSKLEGYPSTSNSGHYVVAYGFTSGWIGSSTHEDLYYFDTYDQYDDTYGTHTNFTFSEMKEAIQNESGYYICKK